MGSMDLTPESLAGMFREILPHLDERQRRLVMGAEARALGHGGIRAVARAAGVREATVSLGAGELEAGAEPLGRARRPGGGARRLADKDPGLVPALLALVEPEERGDPESPLRWTIKSTRKLAAELTRQGHRIGPDTVADLLRQEGFSLQANVKTTEGKQHPDRDAQFRYIAAQASEHIAAGQPVISVDAKKRENVGSLSNSRLCRTFGGDAPLPRSPEENPVTKELEAGAAVHLSFDHFGFVVDALGAAVVMRERDRGGGGADVEFEAAGE